MSPNDQQPARPNFLRREPGILESFLNVCYTYAGILNNTPPAPTDAPSAPYKTPAPSDPK